VGMNQHNKQCIYIALLIGIGVSILGYIGYNGSDKFIASFIAGVSLFISIMFIFISNKCEKCGNYNSLTKIKTDFIKTYVTKNYFTNEERTGRSFNKNKRGDYYNEVEHYSDIDYVTEKTIKVFKDVYRCKFCHNTTYSNEYSEVINSDTHKR
jgi:hypothetical protein